MANILTYQDQDLVRPEVMAEIMERGRLMINDFDFGQAYNLAKELSGRLRNLPETNPFKEQYQNLVNRLQGLTLNLWPDGAIFEFFENGLADALKDQDISMVERVKAKLAELVQSDRDDYRKKLINYLKNNNQLLTKSDLQIQTDSVVGTVKNWLTDYFKQVGGTEVDELQRIDYLANNRNLKKLPQEEKDSVRRLIELLEYLKLSSYSLRGFEESVVYQEQDGSTFLIGDGAIIPLSWPKEAPAAGLSIGQTEPAGDLPILEIKTEPAAESINSFNQEIFSAYGGQEEQKKILAKTEKKLVKKFKNDMIKLRAEFFLAVQSKDVNQTVAILRLLAQGDGLEKFLHEDEKLFKFLKQTWEKQFGQSLAAEFTSNPGQFKFVKLFLQYVLEQRLGLSRNDAARIGMQIGNIVSSLGKPEYKQIAYFDLKTNTFNWFD